MNKVYCYIYKLTDVRNNKCYVGKRVYWYKTPETDTYFGTGKIIKQLIKQHGTGIFVKEILEIVDPVNGSEREIFWIENEKTLYPNGYNIKKGGDGKVGVKRDEAFKQKMSLVRTGYLTKSTRRVYQYTDNQLINIFSSAREAKRKTNINHNSIGKCCRGERLMAGGYYWSYNIPIF